VEPTDDENNSTDGFVIVAAPIDQD